MIPKELVKGSLKSIVLKLLAENNRMYGYEITQKVEELSEGKIKLTFGALYPILHKLEKEGVIKGSWKQEGPKRKRKYYTLTSKGKKYGREQLNEWLTFFNHFLDIVGEVKQ